MLTSCHRNLPSTLSSSSASSATPTQTPSPAELDYEVPTGQWLVNAPYAGIRGSCASRVLNEWFYLIYNCFPYFEDTLAVTETSLGRSYSLAGTFPVEYSEIVGSPPTQSLRYWTFAENFTHAVSGIGNAPGTDHEGTCEASMALKWALGNNKQEIAITWWVALRASPEDTTREVLTQGLCNSGRVRF